MLGRFEFLSAIAATPIPSLLHGTGEQSHKQHRIWLDRCLHTRLHWNGSEYTDLFNSQYVIF
jgi:hypothetical protein